RRLKGTGADRMTTDEIIALTHGSTMFTLIDSNIIHRLATEDATWFEWSSEELFRAADVSTLAINPIIYAEVSIRYSTVEELEGLLPLEDFSRLALPYEA